MRIAQLREEYHRRICREIIRKRESKKYSETCPNLADASNRSSIDISWAIVRRLGCTAEGKAVAGQTAGTRFEKITMRFLKEAFQLLHHLLCPQATGSALAT